jgi:hypothetical protein
MIKIRLEEFINSATSRAGLHEKHEIAEKWNLPLHLLNSLLNF